MTNALRQSAALALLLTLLAGLAPLSQAQDGRHSPGIQRLVSPGLTEALPSLSIPQSAPAPAAAAPPGVWTISAPDGDPHSGYEVAAYALGPGSAIVVHKRFYGIDPDNEYAPAQLVALRTTDGGATWNETVLDGFAPERVGTIDGSIAIDGKGDDVYVAYHERDSGAFASMRLLYAHSADRGVTWTTGTIVDGWAGDFTGLTVLNGTAAVASYHGESYSEGLWVAATTDSGQHWQAQRLTNDFGSGWYTSVGAADAGHLYASHYDGAYPDRQDLTVLASSDGGQTWTDHPVAKQAGHQTGLGSALASPTAQTAYVAYEDDGPSAAAVLLARTHDGAASWDSVLIEQGNSGIGWNEGIKALDASHLLVSYWLYDGLPYQQTGHARVATSSDGGATWSLETVPESADVVPYLDLSATDLAAPFVAYQVWDAATGDHFLRIAHRTPLPPPVPIVHADVALGTLGAHQRLEVPFTLDRPYSFVAVATKCRSSVGSVALVALDTPLQAPLLVPCAAGQSVQQIPGTLAAGAYALEVAAAGSGRFFVEVTGIPS